MIRVPEKAAVSPEGTETPAVREKLFDCVQPHPRGQFSTATAGHGERSAGLPRPVQSSLESRLRASVPP